MALSRLSIIKFLELALTLTCLGLHYNSMAEGAHHTVMLVNGTFVGFTIILVGLFAGYMMSTPINKRIDLFFSLLGCAMFIASGVLILQFWNDTSSAKLIGFFDNDRKTLGITKGSIAVVNGILFFLDVIFTFRD
ncbi:unnamed protein product [Diamesa serratosioi]